MNDDERYHAPSAPPGPPLAGLMELPDHRTSFGSVDRRERTDPFGLDKNARPMWIDPTPPPQERHEAPQLRASTPVELGAPPPLPRPRTSVWPFVFGGLALGMAVTVIALLWMTIGYDEEGLIPLTEAALVAPATR